MLANSGATHGEVEGYTIGTDRRYFSSAISAGVPLRFTALAGPNYTVLSYPTLENMTLDARMLASAAGPIDFPVDLNACLNAHHLYNCIQFVPRLSPEVHRKLTAVPTGSVTDKLRCRP